MARNDIVARYILAFDGGKAQRGILGVSGAARGLVSSLVAGAGAASAFSSAMEFKSLLTDIELKADGGAKAVEGLSERLLKSASEAGQMPIEAAKAYDALLGLGASTKVSDALLEPILKAATAYKALPEDLARSSFALVETLKVPADEAAKALDIMAVAGKAGNVELEDMARSIPSLAAVFGTLGERGSGAVASLASGLEVVGKNAGSAEEAATNFRNLLAKIDSKETRDRFGKLGVDLPKQLKQRTDKGQDIIEAFLGEIGELEAKGVNVKDVVSDQQASIALAALRGNFDEYIRIRDEALKGGAIDKDFERRMQDFGPQLNKFLGIAQILAIEIAGPLLAALTPFLTAIADFATENPTLVKGLVQLAAGLFVANKAAGLFGTSLPGLVRGIGALGVVGKAGPQLPLVARIGSSIKKLGPIIARGALAFGPIGLAAAGAGAAAYAVYKNWDTIGPKLKGAVSKAGEVLMGFADTDWMAKGNDFGNQITSWLNTIDWAAIGTWFNTFFGKIGAQFKSINFVELAGNIGDKISAWFAGVDWAAVGSTIWTVISTIGTIMAAAVSFIGALAWRLLANGLGAAWEKIKTIAANVWQSIKDTAIGAINFIITKINTMIKLVSDLSFGLVSLPSIDKIASSNAAAANGAAAGLPRTRSAPLQGEVTVNLRDQGGRSVGRTRAPVTNSPRGGRRGGFGGGG